MNAKTWIIIVGLGVGSFVAMGMMTKFVVDSNPSLRNVIQFKSALAAELRPRGLNDISVRKIRGGRVFELLLKYDSPVAATSQKDLDAEVADFFLENFKGKRTPATLKLTYTQPGRFGCSEPSPYHDVEVSLRQLQAERALAARRQTLGENLATQLQCRLLVLEDEKRDVRLEVQVPFKTTPSRKELSEFARRVEAHCKRVVRYRTLTVVLRPEADAVPFFEVTVDRRGRAVRPAVAPLAPASTEASTAARPKVESRADATEGAGADSELPAPAAAGAEFEAVVPAGDPVVPTDEPGR